MSNLHTVKAKDRDPRKEYPAQKPSHTPVRMGGGNPYPEDFRSQLEEFSRQSAEQNHVETIEEANDFGDLLQPEDEDFFEAHTVYEMHEIQAENPPTPNEEIAVETPSEPQGDPEPDDHDQSAPAIEPAAE